MLSAERVAEAIQKFEAAQRQARARYLLRVSARPPKALENPAPAVPVAPGPPLSRAATIAELCSLYGHEKRAAYLIASGAGAAQVAATLALLGARPKNGR